MNFLLPLQRFLIARKPRIIAGLFYLELLISPLLLFFAGYWYVNDTAAFLALYWLGRQFGYASFIVFCIVLVPGILRRLQISPIVQAIIMPFRRQLGVLMFVLALLHSGIVYLVPLFLPFEAEHFIENLFLNWHVTFGVLSLSLLFPLWVTSNDYSQYKFKRTWKIIHQLIYVATFTIFMHVAFHDPINLFYSALGVVMLLLLFASWVKSTFFKKQPPVAPMPAPVSSAQPVTSSAAPLTPPTPPQT